MLLTSFTIEFETIESLFRQPFMVFMHECNFNTHFPRFTFYTQIHQNPIFIQIISHFKCPYFRERKHLRYRECDDGLYLTLRTTISLIFNTSQISKLAIINDKQIRLIDIILKSYLYISNHNNEFHSLSTNNSILSYNAYKTVRIQN